ncbi:cilia- and flagella-associated protein 100 isoform X2 [Betta splendens]|uniref:Cilia- and flagella-associated protein 100 isoform X2 n=1 Tax=Betta splendens TaxID=158456 RepID=A0A6P7NV63_BETSP|nr:cilia- and flagella-associated protein 100 isoform X2 [Betta splendens]
MKKRETRQSPFKVPDSKSIFQLNVAVQEDLKEETHKFLALPIYEKTSHAARKMAKLKIELKGELEEGEEGEEGEEREKMKTIKHVRRNEALPKQMTGRHELRTAMMKRENFTKESKHDLIAMERQKAVLELALMTKRSDILRMDRAIAKEEKQLKELEKLIERDNLKSEEFLRENEKKSVEARAFYEQEAKSKKEKTVEIKKLNAETAAIKSELTKLEETLMDYTRYKDLLFKLSPPEWQEAQRAKAMKAKPPSDKEAQDEHSREPEEAAAAGSAMTASEPDRETTPLESSDYEDEPELYFTEPQQLLDLVTELREQNLSLIQNSTRGEETVEELRQVMETTREKIEKDEEHLELQINDVNQRIDKEKAKYNKLKQKVQLHLSLNTEDQDAMFDALSDKVSEVHSSCVGDRMANLNTLEKLASLESHMVLLLLSLESIPKEILEMMRKIKDSERRTREREEKLREQQEKQKDRMRRYLERSLTDSKRTCGKKLMPRCMPVVQKVKVVKKDNAPAQDEIHAYLFTSDETDS